jgi:chromosome partitioning protein
MKVLAILSQKGGVGKTTLATCLAVAAEADGKAAVVLDLDPQATATFWRDNREAETPAVSSLQASRLAVTLQAAAKGGQIWRLSTAPPSRAKWLTWQRSMPTSF